VSVGALVEVGRGVGVDVGGAVGADVGAGRGVVVGGGGAGVTVGIGRGVGVAVGFGRGVVVAVGNGRGVEVGADASRAGSVAGAVDRVAVGETRLAAAFVPVGVTVGADDDERGWSARAVAVGLTYWSTTLSGCPDPATCAAASRIRRGVGVGSGESGRYVATGGTDSTNWVGAARAVPGGASGAGSERWFAGRTT
jgi:hypothetical protein